jgi:ATP-dependent RNA helicase DDX49/DBP8
MFLLCFQTSVAVRFSYQVLDEADRLLTPTFSSDLAELFRALPEQRQTSLFTATMTNSIDAIAAVPPKPGKEKPFIHRMTTA